LPELVERILTRERALMEMARDPSITAAGLRGRLF